MGRIKGKFVFDPDLLLIQKGSSRSGNWGHRGRPGQVGGSAPAGGAILPTEELIERMKFGEWTVDPDYDFARGISESYVATIKDDGRCIVKPGGTYSLMAEESAYDVANMLGYDDLVPVSTVGIGVIPSPTGNDRNAEVSCQQWIEGASPVYRFTISEKDVMAVVPNPKDIDLTIDTESFSRIAMLDAVIGNRDRHEGNIILTYDAPTKSIKAIAIDHNLAFSATRRSTAYKDARMALKDTAASMRSFGWSREKIEGMNLTIRRSEFERINDMLSEPTSALRSYLSRRYGDDFIAGAQNRMEEFGAHIDFYEAWE